MFLNNYRKLGDNYVLQCIFGYKAMETFAFTYIYQREEGEALLTEKYSVYMNSNQKRKRWLIFNHFVNVLNNYRKLGDNYVSDW